MVDADFLNKLENYLMELTKKNEKIKQVIKEKETFQDQCIKLKHKVTQLKQEKSSLLRERDTLL